MTFEAGNNCSWHAVREILISWPLKPEMCIFEKSIVQFWVCDLWSRKWLILAFIERKFRYVTFEARPLYIRLCVSWMQWCLNAESIFGGTKYELCSAFSARVFWDDCGMWMPLLSRRHANPSPRNGASIWINQTSSSRRRRRGRRSPLRRGPVRSPPPPQSPPISRQPRPAPAAAAVEWAPARYWTKTVWLSSRNRCGFGVAAMSTPTTALASKRVSSLREKDDFVFFVSFCATICPRGHISVPLSTTGFEALSSIVYFSTKFCWLFLTIFSLCPFLSCFVSLLIKICSGLRNFLVSYIVYQSLLHSHGWGWARKRGEFRNR